jgi:hypothetical protein
MVKLLLGLSVLFGFSIFEIPLREQVRALTVVESDQSSRPIRAALQEPMATA